MSYIALLAIPSVWGGVTSCSAIPPGTTLATLGTGAGNGCASIDLSYTNFALSNATATGAGTTLPTSSNLYAYSTGTAAIGNTVGPVDLFTDGFASVGGNGTAFSETATISAQVTANTGGSYTGGTYPSPTSGMWTITGLQLNPTASGGGSETIVITENFCVGATSATVGSGGCTAAEQGTLTATYNGSSAAAFTCTFNGSTSGVCGGNGASSSASFSSLGYAVTTVAISETANLSATGVHGSATLTDIENIFTESTAAAATPEPSSFVLMGCALAGLVLLSSRIRRSFGSPHA